MARLESPAESGDNGEATPSSELWTLQEEYQGVVAPSYQFVPLTRRPASFSVSSTNNNSNNDPQLPPATSVGIERNTRDDGTSGAADCFVNGEGFPLLLRRRTFTEPSFTEPSFAEPSFTKRRCFSSADNDGVGRGHYHRAGGGGGGRGRVSMSVSEDNMLSLLSKRSSQALEATRIPPPTPATTPDKLERDMAASISGSISNTSGSSISSSIDGAVSEGVGGAAGTVPMQQQRQEKQANSAAERTRRNEFVIRCAVSCIRTYVMSMPVFCPSICTVRVRTTTFIAVCVVGKIEVGAF